VTTRAGTTCQRISSDSQTPSHTLDPTRWTAGRAPPVTEMIDGATFTDVEVPTERQGHPERDYALGLETRLQGGVCFFPRK